MASKNNELVDKLVKMETAPLKDYKNVVEGILPLFENELNKITDKEDKKQKKMYWSLLSNISGAYYALGNYDKAIEYAKMRQNIDYNNKWRYNLEISEKRKEIVEKNKNFNFEEATKLKVPKVANIKKIGTYRNHIVSALLEINTINKLTNNVQLRDRASYFNWNIYSTIIQLRIPNHYKKSSKESADRLKEYKKIIKDLRANNMPEEAVVLFFRQYPFDVIHEEIKEPNLNFMTETFKLTKYEANVFNGILEKYYMIIQAYSYGKDVVIKDYDKKNEALKEDIKKLVNSRNFTKPIETEILLALEYLNTQKNTKKIQKKQLGNILYNLKTYCSSLSL